MPGSPWQVKLFEKGADMFCIVDNNHCVGSLVLARMLPTHTTTSLARCAVRTFVLSTVAQVSVCPGQNIAHNIQSSHQEGCS